MAVSFASHAGAEPFSEMNTTPLIDVMLVLLIMFIITLPMMTHSVTLEMPNGPPAPEQPSVIDLTIDFDGTVLWNGEVVPDLAQLAEKLHSASAVPNQPELHVRAEKRAAYDTVAKVLATAQRSGMKRIGIVGIE